MSREKPKPSEYELGFYAGFEAARTHPTNNAPVMLYRAHKNMLELKRLKEDAKRNDQGS